MTDLIGQSLGRYRILEQLGEGGMATVYKAYDTRLERDVAIKVIRIEKLTLETIGKSLKRFEREAKALAQLQHPNIVRVIDYGEYEHRPYLVMEYIPAGTLKQRLGKPIPWQSAARFLIPIAHALDYAHRQGIVHRDVKPSNILITKSGEPMLADFGVAKILDDDTVTLDLTGTSMLVGTPEYMAPEQVTGKNVDASTDIYAMGIIFYEMITGRKPYQADTPLAVLFKHASEPLPRPSQFVPDLPEEVEEVLFKALAKNPKNRYQTGSEFANTLTAISTLPIKAKGSMPQKIKPSNPQKKPGRKYLGFAIAMGLLAIFSVVAMLFLVLGVKGIGLLAALATDTATASSTSAVTSISESTLTPNFTSTTTPTEPSTPTASITATDIPTLTFTWTTTETPSVTFTHTPTQTPRPFIPSPTDTQLAPSCPIGDLNHNCVLDCEDKALFQASYTSAHGLEAYNPEADFNNDGVIDLYDLVYLGHNTPAGWWNGCP